MESDHPTSADYASADANNALRMVKKLEKTVEDLRVRVVSLENTLGEVKAKEETGD